MNQKLDSTRTVIGDIAEFGTELDEGDLRIVVGGAKKTASETCAENYCVPDK